MHCLLRGLQRRVGGECVAVLDDFDRIRQVVERDDRKAARREQLGQLCALLAIVRADDERRSRVESQVSNAGRIELDRRVLPKQLNPQSEIRNPKSGL